MLRGEAGDGDIKAGQAKDHCSRQGFSICKCQNHLGVFDKTLGRFPAVLVASEAKTVISFFFFC